MSIDWTEAPDQATHYDCNADVFCTVDGLWHKNQYVPVENKDWEPTATRRALQSQPLQHGMAPACRQWAWSARR